ncbi:MAG: hypothetical protein NVSMB47_12130 [Polyangiales bacterium]
MVGGASTRVLVVDDDVDTIEAVSAALRGGFEVHAAPNGAVGLERVITLRPEVVVFDFWMPVVDGRELVSGIREVARMHVGLVAMSGTPEVEDWCARMGIAAFLRKPFEAEPLRRAVVRALEQARTRTSSTSLGAVRDGAESSRRSSSRRIRVDRAVLAVGDEDQVAVLRALLRAAGAPVQVAAVGSVSEALRALTSIAVDAIAVCGTKHIEDPDFLHLVAASTNRGVTVVVESNPSLDLKQHQRVRISVEPGPASVARALQDAMSPAAPA